MGGFSMVDDKEYTNEELREKITQAKNQLENINTRCEKVCNLSSPIKQPRWCTCGAKERRAEIKAVIAELSLE